MLGKSRILAMVVLAAVLHGHPNIPRPNPDSCRRISGDSRELLWIIRIWRRWSSPPSSRGGGGAPRTSPSDSYVAPQP